MASAAPVDLFAYRASYPDAPGFKSRETSRQAAEDMTKRAGTLQALAMAAFCAHPAGMTADEVATAIGKTVLAIRPRISIMAIANEIIDSGARRRNISGKSAIVWVLA
jgi:hypothetical protein